MADLGHINYEREKTDELILKHIMNYYLGDNYCQPEKNNNTCVSLREKNI
jgi:hypothetical protein